jgi:hypothetical protein
LAKAAQIGQPCGGQFLDRHDQSRPFAHQHHGHTHGTECMLTCFSKSNGKIRKTPLAHLIRYAFSKKFCEPGTTSSLVKRI